MYLTRNMRARIPMTYMGRDLVAGDEFQATDLDAEYFSKHKKAEEAISVPVAEIAPDASEVFPPEGRPSAGFVAPRRRGRPRKNG